MIRLALLAALVPRLALAAVHLVAIGNNAGRADEITLRHAERDARLFGDVLERLGDLQPANRITVTGADADEVRETLAAVEERLAPKASESTLVVYYSGHADQGGLHLGPTTLPYAELKAMMEASPAAVRVLILDGCRSGGLTRVKGVQASAAFSVRMDHRLAVAGTAIITSSAAGEDSHESERLGGSIFTHHLVAGLLGAADHDHDQQVTLTEVYNYAYRHTLRASERTPTLQHATYAYDLKGKGDLVVTRLDNGGSGWLELPRPATWLIRRDDEDGPLFAEVVADEPATRVALPEGDWFVQERHADHYREYFTEVSAGAPTSLGGQVGRRVAYGRLVRKGGSARSQGLYVFGTVQGPVLSGFGPSPGVALGYTLDLPWASFSVRGRFEQSSQDLRGGPSTTRIFGGGLAVERVIDLRWGSVAFGVLGEGLRLDQSIELSTGAVTRSGWGGAFSGLLAVEVPIGALALRLEGGPVTRILPQAEVDNGAAGAVQTTGRFSGWGGLGMGVRF